MRWLKTNLSHDYDKDDNGLDLIGFTALFCTQGVIWLAIGLTIGWLLWK